MVERLKINPARGFNSKYYSRRKREVAGSNPVRRLLSKVVKSELLIRNHFVLTRNFTVALTAKCKMATLRINACLSGRRLRETADHGSCS